MSPHKNPGFFCLTSLLKNKLSHMIKFLLYKMQRNFSQLEQFILPFKRVKTMKNKILIFAFTFLFIGFVLSAKKYKLKSFYNDLMETFEKVQDDDPFISIFRHVDQKCVKEKLNFEENKDKLLRTVDDNMIFWMAHEICLENKNSLLNLLSDKLLTETTFHFDEETFEVFEPPTELSEAEIYCLKENLHDREPTASLVSDFVRKSEQNCDKNVNIFSGNLQILMNLDGDSKYRFNEFPKSDIETLELNLQIIRFTKDKEVKEKQIENLKTEIDEKIKNVFPKVMERINKI